MKYKINKQQCTDCGVCMRECPGATEIRENGKSIVLDEQKIEQCGGEMICPFGAIQNLEKAETSPNGQQQFIGQRRGRGLGRGKGRGLGIGPRDGRGKGRGRGGRRRR